MLWASEGRHCPSLTCSGWRALGKKNREKEEEEVKKNGEWSTLDRISVETLCSGGPVHLGNCHRRWRESFRAADDLWPPPLPIPLWQLPLCFYASAKVFCSDEVDKSTFFLQKNLDLLSNLRSDSLEIITALSFALEGKSKVCHCSLMAKCISVHQTPTGNKPSDGTNGSLKVCFYVVWASTGDDICSFSSWWMRAQYQRRDLN